MAATKPAESALKRILQFIAVPLSLLTALLYLIGQIYYETYLNSWGLSESLFPISKEHSIIAGFFRSLLLGAEFITKLNFVIVALLVIMIVALLSSFKPVANSLTSASVSVRGKGNSLWQRHFVASKVVNKIVDAITTIYTAYGTFILLILLFSLTCMWVEREARRNANSERTKIIFGPIGSETFSPQPHAVLYIKNDSKGFDQYSDHLINTSATHCALYNKTKGVSIFSLTNVSRIVIQENNSERKNRSSEDRH